MDSVTMLDALKFWRKTGIGKHRVHSFVNAHAQDTDELRGVIHLFGSAYIGLDLPQFVLAGDPTGWLKIPWSIPGSVSAEDSAPKVANGHCVTAIGYSEEGIYVVTWGTLKTVSWEFYQRYNVENVCRT